MLAERLPDADIINGDARDTELLLEEGIKNSDAFIALTDNSETNILSCLTAKKLGVKKTVAEVENIPFISTADELDIGSVINKKFEIVNGNTQIEENDHVLIFCVNDVLHKIEKLFG